MLDIPSGRVVRDAMGTRGNLWLVEIDVDDSETHEQNQTYQGYRQHGYRQGPAPSTLHELSIVFDDRR